MSALGKKLRRLEGGRIAFWCPGCKCAHQVRINPDVGSGPVWMWNQCTDAVTLEPSVHVNPPGPYHRSNVVVCHSFVREGRIQFLTDSTHPLKGQTVPLPDFPASAA